MRTLLQGLHITERREQCPLLAVASILYLTYMVHAVQNILFFTLLLLVSYLEQNSKGHVNKD